LTAENCTTTQTLVITSVNAESLSRWALKCATEAENLGTNDASRARLTKMSEALLVLAENDKWLQDIIKPKGIHVRGVSSESPLQPRPSL
jgi:hypothetical protein